MDRLMPDLGSKTGNGFGFGPVKLEQSAISDRLLGVPEQIQVLLVCRTNDVARTLEPMLGRAQCTVFQVSSCREAAKFLCRQQVPIILCESTLADGDWRDILGFTAPLSDSPAIIVASPQADEHLWAEVLNLGGEDVVSQPFDEDELRRVVRAVWRRWLAAHRSCRETGAWRLATA